METQSIPIVPLKENEAFESDLSIVLVCWNNKNYLDPCLQSLYEGQMCTHFDVIVVDNGSTDGSQAMLQQKYPQVRIIQNDHNVGLSRASNQGIDATTGKYVLLLNNDTLVNGSSLDILVYYLDGNPNVGAVGGRLLNPDGSFQAGYADFSTLKEEFLIATRLGELIWPGYPAHREICGETPVGWLCSACLLLRRTALDQVGLLEEDYFIYGDEADLQFRLKKAGWQVCFLPNVTTIHFGGRSMDRWRRRKMVYRGKMLFYKKNYGLMKLFLLRIMIGGLSSIKFFLWALASLLPSWHDRAWKELNSNLEILKLCVRLE